MEDITKYGKYNKIIEVNPRETFFVAYYSNKAVKGTGLNVTGWDALENGILKLQYKLSTGQIVNFPRYKAFLHLVEASMSIDKAGEFCNKNFHYVYVKGIGDNKVYVHKIALRYDPNLGQQIGDIKLYTEEIPNIISNSWKRSTY